MILALLLSAAVLLAPGGLAEAWPAAPRLPLIALVWGLALGLPRVASPRAASEQPSVAPAWLLGLALALPALAAAWVLDGRFASGRLAEAVALCALLAWAGAPRPSQVAGRVVASWALLLTGPWALALLAEWGGVEAPTALVTLAGASPFALLAGLAGSTEGMSPGLPWLLGVHLVACGRLAAPAPRQESPA